MNNESSVEFGAAKAGANRDDQGLRPVQETAEERVTRLYAAPGGPLIGWLFDECRQRGQEYQEMAADLGVTYGYINQLRSGLRQTRHISDDFAVRCARYLGVPPVVVKMVAGRLPMSDFVCPRQSEETFLERAVAQMVEDPVVRAAMPNDLQTVPLAAKRALVSLYAEISGRDIYRGHQLPEIVRWLQRAAVIHDESEGAAVRGHRDAAVA